MLAGKGQRVNVHKHVCNLKFPSQRRWLSLSLGIGTQDSYILKGSRDPWLATVHGVTKELDLTQQLSNSNNNRSMDWPGRGKKELVTQLCPTLWDPMDGSSPGSSVHGVSRQGYQDRIPILSPGNLPDARIKPRSLALQADSLLSEPQGKSQGRPGQNTRLVWGGEHDGTHWQWGTSKSSGKPLPKPTFEASLGLSLALALSQYIVHIVYSIWTG